MSEAVKDFQVRFDLLNENEKLKDVGLGAKVFVAAVTLILDRMPRFHTIIDQTAIHPKGKENE